MPSEEIIENSTSILKLTVYSLTIDHEVCSHFVQWKVTTGQRRWVVPARASTDGRQRWTLLIKHSSLKTLPPGSNTNYFTQQVFQSLQQLDVSTWIKKNRDLSCSMPRVINTCGSGHLPAHCSSLLFVAAYKFIPRPINVANYLLVPSPNQHWL